MIRSFYHPQNGNPAATLAVADFALALQNPNGLLWVDIALESNDASKSILLDVFHFHPLAVDDALEEIHVPKVDDWGEYLYLVVRAVDPQLVPGLQLDTVELDVFLGQNYVVTYHNKNLPAIDRVWNSLQRDARQSAKGADYLLYRLIDEITSDYLLMAEEIDDEINLIEDQLFNDPEASLLEQIFSLKRDLLHLRRIIAPQREMVNKLARGDYAVIEPDARVYFRDVYDHFVRLYDIIENLRDLVAGALEIYLSVVSNRMNSVMKTLTVITTLFMPISFLAGFFGMNFFQPVIRLEAWTGWPAFVVALTVIILFPVLMLWWIRKNKWL